MNSANSYKQDFIMPYDIFKGVTIRFNTSDSNQLSKIIITLVRGNNQLYSWNVGNLIETSYNQGNGTFELLPEKTLSMEKGATYSFIVTDSQNSLDSNKLSFFYTKTDIEGSSLSFGNTKLSSVTLVGNLYGSDTPHYFYLFLACLSLLSLLALMILNSIKNSFINKITTFDIVIAIICIGIVTFSFSQKGDMSAIVNLSRQIWDCVKKGNLLNYYQYALDNPASIATPNYNIILYIIVAIFVKPFDWIMTAIGIDVIKSGTTEQYMNVIVSCFYVLSIWLLKKFLEKAKVEKTNTEIVCLMYGLSPLMLFVTIGFNQLDIFYVCVVLWALCYFMEDKLDLFSFLMGIGIAMKSFPLLIFVPLILLSIKKPVKIFQYLLEGLSFTGAFYLVYGRTAAWKAAQAAWPYAQNAPYAIQLPIGPTSNFSFFLGGILLFCIWCYVETPKNKLFNILIVFICVETLFVLAIPWNPQWTALYGLAVGICFLIAPRPSMYCLYVMFQGFGLIGHCIMTYPANVDGYMVGNSLLTILNKNININGLIKLKEVFERVSPSLQSISISIYITMAIIILYTILNTLWKQNRTITTCTERVLRVRRGAIYSMFVPIICFVAISGTLMLAL
jgi:hypothetical protein